LSGESKKTEKANSTSGKGGGALRSLPFRALDFVIVAAVVLVSLLPLLFLAKASAKNADTVVVTWHGEVIYRGSLDKDAEITTPDGLNTVVIKNGEARMEHAECADERCVRSGAASPAKPVVCLPNRVVVTVTGSEEADSVSW
jgi:hypothetical protein